MLRLFANVLTLPTLLYDNPGPRLTWKVGPELQALTFDLGNLLDLADPLDLLLGSFWSYSIW